VVVEEAAMTIEQATELRDLIKTLAGGTVFSVLFRKRTNNEMREMRCRLGVKRGVKGGDGLGPTHDALERGLLTVYDMEMRGWRSVPLDAIEWIKIRGQVYTNKGAS
jgi:hypothetical protein